MWRQYEAYITEQFRMYYPMSRILPNHKVEGRFSQTRRQIDIAIRTKIEDFELFGVVECKYYSEKIDVKIVESIIGLMEDVGADFGYIITNQGFTKAAQRRIEVHHILLRVVEFSGLSEAVFTENELINKKIQTLDCVPAVFLVRQQQRSAFVNLRDTSFEEKVLVFKEGFVETIYFAQKKLLEETARVFRDFPCIERIRVIIPVRSERQTYSSEIEIAEFQQFLQVDFMHLRTDITLWRSFLGGINKSLVQKFADQYIRVDPHIGESRL